MLSLINFKKKKNFMAPFYGWGSTASRLEPLRGGSLLFTTKFPEIPGTGFHYFTDNAGQTNRSMITSKLPPPFYVMN